MPPTTIRIEDDTPGTDPVSGVLVEFFTTVGVFETLGTSDVAGEVTVDLPIGLHNVFFYKTGVSILPKQPQQIDVLDLPATNIFLVSAHVKELPESVDPLRCKVSGHILGLDGKGSKHRLIFDTLKTPIILIGNIIAPYHRIEFDSDENGYFEFELLRNTHYNAYFVFPQDLFGMQPGVLDVITPNQPAVTLNDFLFPIPLNMDFSANTISLTAGADWDDSIEADVSFSDGSSRDTTSTPWAAIKIVNSDNLVVEAVLISGKLALKPLAAGTATITTEREIPDQAVIDPLEAYTSESVVVTVT